MSGPRVRHGLKGFSPYFIHDTISAYGRIVCFVGGMENSSFAHEEARERILRRVVVFLSAAVIIAMVGWGIYFWHLLKLYIQR